MSAPKYLKCACRHCQGTIEFPAHGLGRAIPCPHCGQKTSLFASAASKVSAPTLASPELQDQASEIEEVEHSLTPTTEQEAVTAITAQTGEAERDKRNPIRLGLVAMLVIGLAAGLLVLRPWQSKSHLESKPEPPTSTQRKASGNPVAPTPAPAPPVDASAAAPKSLSDLKVGDVRLEKASGSSLVYAVGTLHNASTHQRFGIRIELALTTRGGASAGTAKDYRAVLEPQQEWHFRALVLDSKADKARVASIVEDE